MDTWKGSFGIMLTPFRQDGEVDYQEVEAQVDRLCESKAAGLIVCGSTSEFVFCTPEQNMEIMRTAVKAAAGRKKVIGGASSPDRDTTVKYLEYMGRLGMDGALISPPYFFHYSDEETARFYTEITGAGAGVAIIGYHVPMFTSPVGERTFEALLGCEQIIGLKNSGQNIREISRQIQKRDLVRDDFLLFTGTEEALFPCLAAGCNGGFTASGALLPDYMQEIYLLFQAGEYELSRRMQMELLPLLGVCARWTFPVGYKLFGRVLGWKDTYLKQSLTEAQQEEMEASVNEMERLYEKVKAFRQSISAQIEQAELALQVQG